MAKKDVLFKPRGVSGFVGALRQYTLLNCNGFKPVKGTTTSSDYMPIFNSHKRVDKKIYKIQKRILTNYKSRSQSAGKEDDGFVLNIEEMASLYHFPLIQVSSTSVQTADAKRGGAPLALPTEEDEQEVEETKPAPPTIPIKNEVDKTTAPPDNLPV